MPRGRWNHYDNELESVFRYGNRERVTWGGDTRIGRPCVGISVMPVDEPGISYSTLFSRSPRIHIDVEPEFTPAPLMGME